MATLSFTAYAIKINSLPLETQDNLGVADIFLVDNEVASSTSTRKISTTNLDLRWLQAPNDVGTGINDLWSASKIISEIATSVPTFQTVYNNSTGGIDLLEAKGPMSLQDGVTPLSAELFKITNSAATVKYFSVDANKTSVGAAILVDKVTAPTYEEGLIYYDHDAHSLIFLNDEYLALNAAD